MSSICYSDVSFRVIFYPRELKEDAHLDHYVCSITCSNLKEARNVTRLYYERGFNVAIWEEKEITTRIEVMEAEE